MCDVGSTARGATLSIQLLGTFRVTVGSRVVDEAEWRLRKAKSLLKLLALAPGYRLHREQVMEVLWPDADPEAAANGLYKALHTARRALEPDLAPASPSAFLRLDGDLLALQSPGPLWIDVDAFEAAAARARQSHDPAAYRAALDLYAGELLPEDRYEDWAAGRREELRGRYQGLLLELARLEEARGDLPAAIESLRRVVASDPAFEEAQAGLMRLHALAGQRHQALRQYEQLRRALRRELEVEPDPATQRLYQDIVAGRLRSLEAVERSRLEVEGWKRPESLGPSNRQPATSSLRPLVGRDREVEALEEQLEALFDGQGRLVLLGGEAGVGKSRLALEAADRVRRRGGLALLGAGYEQEGRLPYGPFAEAVEGFVRGVGPAAAAPLAPLFALRADGDGGRGWGPPAAPAPEEAADRQRLFGAFADFFRRLAGRAPVVVVLDDLHAADEASLQLLHYLARSLRDAPVLLLGTFRAEETAPGRPLGQLLVALQRERLAVRLELERLAPRESELLVASLLGGGPVDRSVFETVYELAAGNPFYTEEAVRALREAGQLHEVDGRWQMRAELAPLPRQLAELVAVRLERLGPGARQALALAAVLGREAPYTLLRTMADPATGSGPGLSEGDLLDALDECLERRVLEETPDGYRFAHPLLRAGLYERLSRARRASLHARAAAALERLHGGHAAEQAEALAHHLGLSDQPGRAVPYLVLAGDRAAAVYANEAAIGHYRRALELLGAPGAPELAADRVAELWEKVGDLQALVGEHALEVEAYRAALAALDGRAEHRLWRARLERKAAYACLGQHDADAAERHLLDGEALAGPDEPAEQARLRRVRALWLWERRRHAEALEVAQESLELAERHGGPADRAAAYETLALVCHSCGEWKRGLHFEIQHLGAGADDPQLGQVLDVHH